jgi:hypothetical protein
MDLTMGLIMGLIIGVRAEEGGAGQCTCEDVQRSGQHFELALAQSARRMYGEYLNISFDENSRIA